MLIHHLGQGKLSGQGHRTTSSSSNDKSEWLESESWQNQQWHRGIKVNINWKLSSNQPNRSAKNVANVVSVTSIDGFLHVFHFCIQYGLAAITLTLIAEFVLHYYYYYYIRSTAFFQDNLGKSAPER